MWLEENERRLLEFYYSKLGGRYPEKLDLDKETLIDSMKLLNSYKGDGSELGVELDIMKSLVYKDVSGINTVLKERGLIKIDTDYSMPDNYGKMAPLRDCISLTLEGCDLARKYNNKFDTLTLWWQEYKLSPIWIILGFIATTVVSIIVGVVIGRATK